MVYYEFKVLVGYGRAAYCYEYIFNNINDAKNFYNNLSMECRTFKKKFIGINECVIAREGYDIVNSFNLL